MVNARDAVWMTVLPDMSGFGGALVKGAGKEADKQGRSVGQRFGKALNIGVAAVVTGAVTAGTALYKIGETFDEVRDNLRAGTGATGKDLDAFVENVKNVGRVVPAEFTQIGDVVGDLNTRLDLTGPVLEEMTTQILNLSRVMGEEIDVEKLSHAFKQFGVEAEDMSAAMDLAYNVSQTTGVGVNDLMGSLQRAAPAASNLGLSFDEAAVMTGNLHKAGLDAGSMMDRMTRNLGNVAEAGESPRETFERVTKQIGDFVEAGDKGAAIELAKKAWGARAGEQFVKGIEDGTLAIENLTDISSVGTDTIADTAAETIDFAEHWQMFKNEIMAELAPAAEWLFAKISEGMKWIKDNAIPIIRTMVDWLSRNASWLMPLAGFIGAVVAAVKIWTTVQTILNAVMLANPIGIVVAAIAGLVAAFVIAYNKSETFRKIVDAAWQGIKKAAQAVWDFLKKWVFGPIIAYYKLLWTAALAAKDWIVGAWTTMKAGLQAGWDWIKRNVFDRFTDGVAVLRSRFSDAVDRVKNIWGGIKAAFKKPWDWIKTNVFDRFSKGLDNLKGHVETIKDGIGKAWRGIANLFRNPINWVLDKVWNGGIAKAFNAAAGALGLKTRLTTEAQIPAFAKGGLAKKGWALVGEEGPELVNFSNPGRVYTASETAAALGLTTAPDAAGHTDSLPMGGGILSRAWEGVKSAAGAVTGWVRGGLAKAADLLLSPIRKIIAPTVKQWGTFGQFAGGAITNSLDSLVKWIRGKDDVGDAGGIQADLAGGRWLRPSLGRVTSRYGPRSLMGMNFHAGIDYAGGPFTYAAAAGKVFKTGWNILSGRSGIGIGIDHGGGVFTYYGHNPSLSAIKVKPGDMVRAGQHIGREGATGNITGPHLHFEVHRGGWGRHVNPSTVGLFDQGGLLKPGMVAYHSARMSKPDAVLTARQWDDIHRLAIAGGAATIPRGEMLEFARIVAQETGREVRAGAREGMDVTSRRAEMGAGLNRKW